MKDRLVECMVGGGLFIISIDDSEVHYEELSEPDLSDFFNGKILPRGLLELKTFKDRENFSKVLEGTEFEGEDLHEEFRIAVWTRLRIDESNNFE